MQKNRILLLNTHVWLWLLLGDKKIRKCTAILEEASARENIRVSAISFWEVAMLHSKARILLHMDCIEFLKKGLYAPGVSLLHTTPEIACQSNSLQNFHGDPADRIITATSRIYGACRVTYDRAIQKFAKISSIDVLAV